jgi:DNA-binding NtrC family response regulator
MTTKHSILLIEREQGGGFVRRALESEQQVVKSVTSVKDAHTLIHPGVDLVLCELATGRDAAFKLVSCLSTQTPRTPIVLLVETGDVESAVQGMKLGAADCLTVPVDSLRLRLAVAKWARQPATNELANRGDVAAEAIPAPVRGLDIPAGTSLDDLERAAVEHALASHGGNRTHAAQELGISVRTLQRKLKTWGPPILLFHGSSMGPQLMRETYSTPLDYIV